MLLSKMTTSLVGSRDLSLGLKICFKSWSWFWICDTWSWSFQCLFWLQN